MRRYTVEVSPQTLDDLDAIAGYIAQSAPINAERFLAKLSREIEGLARFPLRHRIAPENVIRGYTVRHALCGNYRILFCVRGSIVQVHGVRHAKRLPE